MLFNLLCRDVNFLPYQFYYNLQENVSNQLNSVEMFLIIHRCMIFTSDILIGIYFRIQNSIVYGNKVVKIQNFSRKSFVCPQAI